MYVKKLKYILKLIEENHLDMYFNISKDELDSFIKGILNEKNIKNDYDFYYYTNVIIKKIFGKYDSHTKLIFDDNDFYLPVRFKFINNKFWATLIYFILIIILSYIYHRIVKKINKYLK